MLGRRLPDDGPSAVPASGPPTIATSARGNDRADPVRREMARRSPALAYQASINACSDAVARAPLEAACMAAVVVTGRPRCVGSSSFHVLPSRSSREPRARLGVVPVTVIAVIVGRQDQCCLAFGLGLCGLGSEPGDMLGSVADHPRYSTTLLEQRPPASKKWNTASTLTIPSERLATIGSRTAPTSTESAMAPASRSHPAASWHWTTLTAINRRGRTTEAIT
jgi:hypothetical protein